MIHIILFIAVLAFGPNPSPAQEMGQQQTPTITQDAPSSPDDFRPLRPGNPGRVDQIIDATKLRLQDGRIVDLAAIDVPDEIAPDSAAAVRNFFKETPDQAVSLYVTANPDLGRMTRLGHDLVHMVRQKDGLWIQAALIRAGLARAWPTPANPEHAALLFAAEDDAIAEKIGLWSAESKHAIRSADELNDRNTGLMVVEGTVRSTAIINNVTYLNFGPDWKTDFTIALPRAVRLDFSKRGVDVLQLQRKFIRARGWVRSYNGPYMELEHALLLQHDIKSRTEP